ncbi:MAG: primary-amine oxidase [Chloroflexota bacterium]
MSNQHMLDPLTTAEITQTVELVKNTPQFQVNDALCFNIIRLLEPLKETVLNATPNSPKMRRAFSIVFDRATGQTYEVVANLTGNSIESVIHIPNVRTSILAEEFDLAEAAAKVDPRFQEAMAKRGITDMSKLFMDPWCCGFYGDPLEEEYRLVRGIAYVTERDGDNFYARPVENVLTMIDINTMKVIRVDDHGVVPVPAESGDYLTGLVDEPQRTDLKQLDVVQPDGVSFTVDGWQVQWQKWRFRIGFNHREGLTLHEIGYEDGGEVRPILYRASVAEMTVPYGDASVGQYRKNAFDSGEYGLGMLTNSLKLGCDCLGEIKYFDADLVAMNGEIITIPNAICLHEEDYSLLWKHYDFRRDTVEVRRSRRLVVSFIATVGNYEYGFYWNFYQDGNIQLDVKMTGILQTGAYHVGDEVPFGAALNNQLYASNHQHFFCVRLDPMVDGINNTVVEVDTVADPTGPSNPYGNAFYAKATPLTTEQEAQRLIDPFAARYWTITNPSVQNKVGKPVAYKIMPGENCLPFARPDSWIAKRAGYMFKHLWVTPFHADENFPAGDYVYQSQSDEGLPKWTAQNRSVENQDIVVWYVMGHNHLPRLEDWPVMPVAQMGMMLKPSGFFDKSPAMDVPPNHSLTSKACC